MDAIESKTTKPDDDKFCDKCGAAIMRKDGFRDRQATEMEITESVASRLMKWAGWVRNTVGVIVALFALLLGWSYLDVRSAVGSAKVEIGSAAANAKNDIDAVRRTAVGLKGEVGQIQSDIDGYKQVNASISKLQKQITSVQGQVVDLGSKSLVATDLTAKNKLTLSGKGPFLMNFAMVGCPPVGSAQPEWPLALCLEGDPAHLAIVTHTGAYKGIRPVGSFSTVGFQESSTGPRPVCTEGRRGTFYVEKGTGKIADKPLLCVRKSDNSFEWIDLAKLP